MTDCTKKDFLNCIKTYNSMLINVDCSGEKLSHKTSQVHVWVISLQTKEKKKKLYFA